MEFLKKATEIISRDMENLKKLYNDKKSIISKELNTTEKNAYVKMLTFCYTIFDVPRELIVKKLSGGITGFIILKLYDIFVVGFKGIVRLFDLRTYINIWLTIVALVKNCLVKPIKYLLDKLIQGVSDLFDLFRKAIGLEKKKNKRITLTESIQKRILLESSFIEWFKSGAKYIINKVKNVVIKIVKTGYNFLENLFLTAIYPVCKCISNSNKITTPPETIAVAGRNIANSISANAKLKGMGLVGAAVTPVFSSSIFLFSGFMAQLGMFTTVFFIASKLSTLGYFLTMKNMFMDVFV